MSNYNPSTGKYATKDSGKRFEASDGMVRDTSEGKPQFTLLFPQGVPFEDQLMTRVADLYHRGGVKYGPRNWEKSCTEESLAKHEDCLMRHVIKFLLGVADGEDHAAAVVWNVNAVDLTRRNLKVANAARRVIAETYPTEIEQLPDNEVTRKIDTFLSAHGVKEVQPEYETPSERGEVPVVKTREKKEAHMKAVGGTYVDEAALKAVDEMGERDAAAEFIAKTNKAVEFPNATMADYLAFSEGDELLDKNYTRWVYKPHGQEMAWAQSSSNGLLVVTAGVLAKAYGPLMLQTGAHKGITIRKDGRLTW